MIYKQLLFRSEKKIMNHHIILALIVFELIGMTALLNIPSKYANAQADDSNAIARYSQQIISKLNLCQDNPFRSHEIPPIVIPGPPGKNGGIAIYGNANATEHGQNGAISIGGAYSDRSGGASANNDILPKRGGNGGIAFCGIANGANATTQQQPADKW